MLWLNTYDIVSNLGSILTNSQIHKAKAEKQREKNLKEEMDAKRAKVKAARERRIERKTAKQNALAGEDETTQQAS